MHNVIVLDIPHSFPTGWDIADAPPEGLCFRTLLDGSPAEKTLADMCISTEQLAAMDIPPRDYLIEPFILTQSLNMLYAKRGVGKTWAAIQVAVSIATGTNFFAYKATKQGRVLYVDGEMTLFEIQERFKCIEGGLSSNIEILPSELLHRNQQALNLHYDEDQSRFLQCLEALLSAGRKFDLIIFDNLSSLLSGKDENDNTELEKFMRFLLGLRHRGYAVMLIHHAGKSGDQRGASRREDFMDTIIKLEPPQLQEGQIPHEGAHFILSFTKTRGKAPKPQQVDARLVAGPNGLLTWSFAETGYSGSRADEALKLVHDRSMTSQTELARAMSLTKGRISQIIRSLRKNGLIYENNLELTDLGKLHLASLWPEDYAAYTQIQLPF